MRAAKVLPVVATLVALPLGARAEEGPVPVGTFALSAERMSGFFHTNVKSEGVRDSLTYDELTILGNLSITGAFFSPYTIPRFAMDGFVIDGLSIGAGAGLMYLSFEDSTLTAFLINPRLGYATFLSEDVGLWPRAGISYMHASSDSSDENRTGSTTSHLAMELEVPLLFGLSEDVWIQAGPIVGIPITGSRESDAPEAESSEYEFTTFGVSAGLTAAF